MDNTNQDNSKRLLYSIGEIAEMFDVNPSLIRFWEQRFAILKPKKNRKGNRMFTPEDLANLKKIYHLVKERGMTLSGAERVLKNNKGEIDRDTEIVERLQKVKSMLLEVKQELDDIDTINKGNVGTATLFDQDLFSFANLQKE